MSFVIRNTAAEVKVTGRCGNVRASETNGRHVRNISVAFQRSWAKKDENGNQTGEFDHKTAWIEFACWEFAAEKASNIEQGDVVECTFSLADLNADLYEKDGASKASIKVGRATVLLISKKNATSSQADEPIEVEPVMAEEAI